MKKRVISLLLVLCMLLTMLPMAALADQIEQTNPFRDVKKSDWFYDSVMYVYANGLFAGVSDTEFDPSGTMTRGMFVTVLGRLAGVDTAKYKGVSEFTDVNPDAFYAPYVAWAYRHGITDGMGNGMFDPDGLIDRQQMATFFDRYFELFGVRYADQMSDSVPADLDQVAPWAKDAVLRMWQAGILMGDGVSFAPTAKASRAEAATLCTRLDQAVEIWYKEPGVPSDRIKINPEIDQPQDGSADGGIGGGGGGEEGHAHRYRVRFYDGQRFIEEMLVSAGHPTGAVPSVENASKEGAVLLGYYYDEAFTRPFYANDPVIGNTNVYAKYQQMEKQEELTVRTFTQMDQNPNLQFDICRTTDAVAGEPQAARVAAALEVKDGSDPVELAARDNGDGTYTIYAPAGFNEGCSYTLTLENGWQFAGKEVSIRTASFSIAMEEVENLRMGDDIIYVQDTDAMFYAVAGQSYPVLTSEVLSRLVDSELRAAATGTFNYPGNEVEAGDVLCIYTGKHPLERENNGDLLDPAVYVKATGGMGDTVSFTVMDEAAQQALYELPDNFPIRVAVLPTETSGEISLADLDISMYESMVGSEVGTLDGAREALSVGDFVTLYVNNAETALTGNEAELYFGRVESFDGDTITYTQVTKQDILDSMDLYTDVDLAADDLISADEAAALETEILEQIKASGFAEEAAWTLVEMATLTEEFRADPYVQELLITDENGNELPRSAMDLLAAGSFSMNRADLDVHIGSGSRYGGVEIAIHVDASFTVEAEDGFIDIGLSASFTEEVKIAPTAKGSLVYKEILGIPIPIGVHVGANVDVLNYTAFSFAAEITTREAGGGVLNTTSISSDLDGFMATASQTGLSEDYYTALESLMQKYGEMLQKETDWIKLVDEEIFSAEVSVCGLVIGISTDFVVRTDMSIAIGSSLLYEVGKRYSFWFEIGLFEPTAGSDTMDIIDEQFAFRFYVLGKLGVKAGVKAKLYVGLGSGKVANVGITAELGPYLKLWGLFIYDYTRLRAAGSSNWNTSSRMIGGLNLEFGLYYMLGFEAEALDLFEYSYDFLDEEIPLLEAGDPKYYYAMNFEEKKDEKVFIWDEDRDLSNGVTMGLPDGIRRMKCLNLKSGVLGTDLLGYENFSVILSHPCFTYDQNTGKISVSVPDGVRYMECEAVVTYLHGKMAFSNYDISAKIPLVWTDLSLSELKEYYTVSVRVGNVEDGYETVWTERILKGQAFDLPSDTEIQKLAGWSELKYAAASGYTTEQTTGLTVITDTVYTYEATPQTYSLAVSGIQNADGTLAAPRTFTAKYGEAFDFSELETTGTDDAANAIYTKFTNVTTDYELATAAEYYPDGSMVMTGEPMDLSLPIGGAMALALKSGNVQATANYVDDSTTAVFTFSGLTHEDVVVKLRKGEVPDMSAVEAVLEEEVRKLNGQPLGISEVSPTLSAIDRCTNYVVTCVGVSGARAYLNFDSCGGSAVASMDKLVGSLIVNIPEPTRRGYTFRGWFTEPNGCGQSALTQTIPAEGITVYAYWTPNPYIVTFHMNGGDGNVPEDLVVTYDDLYGNGNHYVYAPEAEFGFAKGDAYGPLPSPKYTEHTFLGWSTMTDRKAGGAIHVQDSTVADIYDEHHTLYAQWKPLEIIPRDVFVFGSRVYYTYDGTGKTLNYTVDTTKQYIETDYDSTVTKNFTEELLSNAVVEYKRQGILSEWTSDAVNAGVYDVRITREADDNFTKFQQIYYGVLEIKKADSAVNQTPTASCIADEYYGNLIMNPNAIQNYTGDGCVEFAVTTSTNAPAESAWTSGVIYNSNTASEFYLWVRLSEGDNYKASAGVCSSSKISLKESGPKQLIADDYDGQKYWYTLEVKTSDTHLAGTGSGVYASIGNSSTRVKLDSSADDHETGDCREYLVTMGNYLPTAISKVPVTISLEKGGNNPGWKLGYLRLHMYKNTGDQEADLKRDPVMSSNKYVEEDWFLAKENERSSATFTLSGFGRDLTYDITGASGNLDVTKGGTMTMTMSDVVIDGYRGGLTYNASQRYATPQFVASFEQDKAFNKYLRWYHDDSGKQWVCTLDCDGAYARMQEIGMYQLTLTYGIESEGLTTVYVTVPVS